MQKPQIIGSEGWVEFAFNGASAVIQKVNVYPDRIEFGILSHVPRLTWSVDCDPEMQTVSLFGQVDNLDAINELSALRNQIEESKALILEACRLYGARTAKLIFPGSTDY